MAADAENSLEIERLRSLTRFQDAVIRSGDVACLTQAERLALRKVRDVYAAEDDRECNEIAAVVDGLLERMNGHQ